MTVMQSESVILPFMGDPWLDWGAANFAEFADDEGLDVHTDLSSWRVASSSIDAILATVENRTMDAACQPDQRTVVHRNTMELALEDSFWWASHSRLADSNAPTESKASTLKELLTNGSPDYHKLMRNCAKIYMSLRKRIWALEDADQKDEIEQLQAQLENKDRSVAAAAAVFLGFEIDRAKAEPRKIGSAEFWQELRNSIGADFCQFLHSEMEHDWKAQKKEKAFEAYVAAKWKFCGGKKAGNKFYYSRGELKSKARRTEMKEMEIMKDYIPHVTTKSKGSNCVSNLANKACFRLGPIERVRALCANINLGYISSKTAKIFFWPVADNAENLNTVARGWRGAITEANEGRSNFPGLSEWRLSRPHEMEWAIAFEFYCWLKAQQTTFASGLWKNHLAICFLREDGVKREYRVYNRFSDFVRVVDIILDETQIVAEDLRQFIKGLYSKSSKNDKNDWLWRERICERFLNFQDIGAPLMELGRQESWKDGKRTGRLRRFHFVDRILPAYYKALNHLNAETDES